MKPQDPKEQREYLQAQIEMRATRYEAARRKLQDHGDNPAQFNGLIKKVIRMQEALKKAEVDLAFFNREQKRKGKPTAQYKQAS